MHWSSMRGPGFVAVSLLSLPERIPDFHNRVLCGLLFLALVIVAGELSMGLRPLALLGKNLCSRDIPPDSQPLHMDMGKTSV